MFGLGGTQHAVAMTLYTDAFVLTGSVQTSQRRVSDILNQTDEPFLILSDVTMDEFGTAGQAIEAPYAQVNLAAVLFAVAHDSVEPLPELRTPKAAEQALISIPPFKVTGSIHVFPDRDLRVALAELTEAFIPVTAATYWSDTLHHERASAALVAINRSRAQIMAPHREPGAWPGLIGDEAAPSVDRDQLPAAGPDRDPWR